MNNLQKNLYDEEFVAKLQIIGRKLDRRRLVPAIINVFAEEISPLPWIWFFPPPGRVYLTEIR